MSQLSFSQSERRSYLGPIILAVCVLIAIGIGVWFYIPHHTAELTITHTDIVPAHTEMSTGSKVVGHETETQDSLYVLTTLHIDNKLRDPLSISGITATFTTPKDGEAETSAVDKGDFAAIYTAFPQIKPFAGTPLLREATIPPGGSAQGTIMLNFPITKDDWANRKSATLTVAFYHQDPITIEIPK